MSIFYTTAVLGTGQNPVDNAVADLNGDGHLDLLVTNYTGDSVSVWLGSDDGTFTFAPSVATGNPRTIVTGDVDGDGDVDFLAANLAGGGVTIGLNTGNGTFTTSSVTLGGQVRGVDLADLDGDGDLDFVAVNYGNNNLSVMLGNGDGTFAAAAGGAIPTGGTRPVQVVIADFDGDGHMDLATANNTDNTVAILAGNGDGSFDAPLQFGTGPGPRGITSGDIDGDGDIDLIVGDFSGGSVSVLRNDGTGHFGMREIVLPGGNNPYEIALGDLDGDGDLDMVVSNSGSGLLGVLFNNGAGNFSLSMSGVIGVGSSPGGVSLADFDGDGDLDIATSNFGSHTSTILLNAMATYSVSATSDLEERAGGTAGELVFTITRTATSEAETVTYDLGGTAVAGSDYVAPGSLTANFAAGQDTVTIRIPILSDVTLEDDEYLTLNLTGTSGEGRLSPHAAAATATIINNELPNIAPTGTDRTLTVIEDDSRTLTASNFGFADGDGHNFAGVRIATTPASGQLLLNGVPVTAGQVIAISDIDAGGLSYRPAANGNGSNYASFTFQVADDGGTYLGGMDMDLTPNRMTFDVTAVNDAPVLTGDLAATVAEGGSYVLTGADIGFSDVDDSASGVVFRVSGASNGTLLVSGTVANSFTAADLAAGRVSFTHNGSETSAASFRVLVEDGNEDGSTPVVQTFDFAVTAVNDAPVLTGDLAATVAEGGRYVLTGADIGFSDVDDSASGVVFRVSGASNGTLLVGGAVASSFTAADLAAGQVSFKHDGSETTNASFRVLVEDGNEDGSTPVERTFDFAVTAVNDAPVLTGDLAATVAEGGSYVLTGADIDFSDSDDGASGVVFRVSGASNGTLLVGGAAASSFTAADITAGRVSFAHNGSETSAASFRVLVEDGNEDGSAPVVQTFDLDVTPVNDAPILTGDLAARIAEGGSYVLTGADIGFSDVDDKASGVVFRVSGESNGTLRVSGAVARSFSAADLAAGRVSFTHDGSETNAASFRVLVEDGNEDRSVPVAQTFRIDVTSVNDAPKLKVSPLVSTLAENVPTSDGIKIAKLTISDPDGGTNHLSLAGADASLFTIKSGALWLKAGAVLDFETNPALDVTVRLDDPSIGKGIEDRQSLSIALRDIAETLVGTSGNDRIKGTSASETLSGRAGNDSLIGGAGDDRLIGGLGVDMLRGGGGADMFIFRSVKDSGQGHTGYISNGPLNALSGAGKRDVILDFDQGQDRIDFSGIDTDPDHLGDQAFIWRGEKGFSDGRASLIFRQFDSPGSNTDRTIIYGDLDHDGRADLQVELAGLFDLTARDFIF